MHRRQFVRTLGSASVLAALPLAAREAVAQAAGGSDLVIREVDVLRLTGAHEELRGVNHQPQVQPLHLYAERRPPPYRDAPNPRSEKEALTQHYVRVRTQGGQEGIYGAVDREALPTLLGPLRTLLIGQDALAIEQLWDQMYRSNRHSRASHYMMAISYLDNALWDPAKIERQEVLTSI